MLKIIWTCWFQGREAAPPVVQACLNSWERKNPGWELRCLDAATASRYVRLADHIDLTRQQITAASLSDILRILLLHEFGGVWVDATLYCNRPLDEWLPQRMDQGFFAFEKPGPDRLLSSWFLAARPGSRLVSAWCRKTMDHWSARSEAKDYFWFHYLFGAVCAEDLALAQIWNAVPKISALGPQLLQDRQWLDRAPDETGPIDWAIPVFKLMHRLPQGGIVAGSLLETLLADDCKALDDRPAPPPSATSQAFASLKVSTDNLGDHMQILAGLDLLSRLGIEPGCLIDRDDEISSAPMLESVEGPVGILLNGWFKTNRTEWPPHPKLTPLYQGFHIRHFQCPELTSDESLAQFRRHQPIGCRDPYTAALLRQKGVAAFVSDCLTMTLPRRIERPESQTEIFVVSRDARIMAFIPTSLGPYRFVSHYSGIHDFDANLADAAALLEMYRDRAKLIVTTLLHCALPAIAMGIPVVVFWPLNDEAGHVSDKERFSGLAEFVPIHRLDERDRVNWAPRPVPVSRTKLRILEGFYAAAARQWSLPEPPRLGPIAPAELLRP